MSLLLQSSPACGATTASGTAQGRPVLSQCGPAHGCKAGPVWSDHHNLARRQRMYGHQLGRCWLPIRQPAASLLRCSAPTSPPRSLVRHSSSIGPVSAECTIAPDQVPQRQVGMDRPMCRIRHTSFYRCPLFRYSSGSASAVTVRSSTRLQGWSGLVGSPQPRQAPTYVRASARALLAAHQAASSQLTEVQRPHFTTAQLGPPQQLYWPRLC